MVLTLPLGLAVGLVIGATGAGGSILLVPALVYLVGLTPQEATTVALVVVGLVALTGLIPHARAGRVRFRTGLSFGAAGAAGAVAGSALNRVAPPDLLMLGFAALAGSMAALMVARSRAGLGSSEVPAAHDVPVHAGPVAPGRVLAVGSVVGLLTGLFGVGGGFVVVPALVVVLGVPVHLAVGTSLVVVALNAAVALAARVPGPVLDTAVVLPVLVMAMGGVLAGSRVAGRATPERLQAALVVLLLVVGTATAVPATLGLLDMT